MSSNDKKNVVSFDAKKKPAKKINGVMIGSVIILVLSAIVFILVPALTGFQGTSTEAPVIGSYKGTEIKYEQGSDFVNYMNQTYQQVKDSGYDVDQYMYSILQSAFNNTITSMAIEDSMKESQYVVPDTAVNRAMRSYFTDENGNFSAKAYNEADKSTVQELFKSTEKELNIERYFADFIGLGGASYYGLSEYLYGAKISSNEASFFSDFNADKRQFQFVAIDMLDLPEEEYMNFAKANPSIFEHLDFSICSASDKETMEEIANLIKNNQITFDDAVATMSSGAYDAIDGKIDLYNYQIKDSLLADPEDYDDFVALGVGDISTIVHTQQGYAIFRRNAANVAADLTDPAVQEVVSAYVRVYEKGYIEDYFMDQAKDFATDISRHTEEADTYFKDIAEEMGYEYFEPSAFPCNYGNDSVLTTIPTSQYEQLSGAETNRSFLKTLFALELGEVSEPILLDDYVVIARYNESVPKDEAIATSMETMYPYYTSSYAQSAIQNAIINGDGVDNGVLSFYFKYFMNYGD